MISVGFSRKTVGPGFSPLRKRMPRMTAVKLSPGIPKTVVGMRAPPTAELFASAAAKPSNTVPTHAGAWRNGAKSIGYIGCNIGTSAWNDPDDKADNVALENAPLLNADLLPTPRSTVLIG